MEKDKELQIRSSAVEHNNATINSNDATDGDERSRCSVNVHMLPAKAAFIFRMCMYDKLMFSMLYYLSLGLPPLQAGLVNGWLIGISHFNEEKCIGSLISNDYESG